MRYLPRAFLAGGIGFAVSCLAACGGGAGLLSGNQSAALQNRLDQLSAAVSSGDCSGAASRANALSNKVLHLPNTINVTLRQDLLNGVATASSLAARDCHQNQNTTTSTSSTSSTTTSTPTTTSTTSTTPTTTSSTTTSTTSTTTTTTSTPTTSTTTTTSPSGGGGLGGGGDGGSGGALGGGGGNGQAGDPGAAGPASAGGHHA